MQAKAHTVHEREKAADSREHSKKNINEARDDCEKGITRLFSVIQQTNGRDYNNIRHESAEKIALFRQGTQTNYNVCQCAFASYYGLHSERNLIHPHNLIIRWTVFMCLVPFALVFLSACVS